jgi:hypothetical protein
VSGKSLPKSALLPPRTPRALGTPLLGTPALVMLPVRSLTRRVGVGLGGNVRVNEITAWGS